MTTTVERFFNMVLLFVSTLYIFHLSSIFVTAEDRQFITVEDRQLVGKSMARLKLPWKSREPFL